MVPLNPQAGATNKVEFAYDYMGRRVQKKVYDWVGGQWQENTGKRRKFVWSGWLMLMELDQNNNAIRKYTWALELAGQSGQSGDREGVGLEAAGGLGGLLALEDLDLGTPQTGGFQYLYDATLDTAVPRQGQASNVGQLIDADDGTLAVRYQYDPYGAPATSTRSSGSGATCPVFEAQTAASNVR